MADKKPAAKKAKSAPKSSKYELKEGKISRKNQSCPRCGDGVFLANHADRLSCGKCGYTEYKKKAEAK